VDLLRADVIEIEGCKPLSKEQIEIIREAVAVSIIEPVFYYATQDHIEQLKAAGVSGISRKQRKN